MRAPPSDDRFFRASGILHPENARGLTDMRVWRRYQRATEFVHTPHQGSASGVPTAGAAVTCQPGNRVTNGARKSLAADLDQSVAQPARPWASSSALDQPGDDRGRHDGLSTLAHVHADMPRIHLKLRVVGGPHAIPQGGR